MLLKPNIKIVMFGRTKKNRMKRSPGLTTTVSFPIFCDWYSDVVVAVEVVSLLVVF